MNDLLMVCCFFVTANNLYLFQLVNKLNFESNILYLRSIFLSYTSRADRLDKFYTIKLLSFCMIHTSKEVINFFHI